MEISEVKNQRTQLWVRHMCAYHVWRSNIEGGHVSSYLEQPHTLGLETEYHTQKVKREVKSAFVFFARAARFWRAPSFWDNIWSHTKPLAKTDCWEYSSFALKTHWWKWASSPSSCSCRHFWSWHVWINKKNQWNFCRNLKNEGKRIRYFFWWIPPNTHILDFIFLFEGQNYKNHKFHFHRSENFNNFQSAN